MLLGVLHFPKRDNNSLLLERLSVDYPLFGPKILHYYGNRKESIDARKFGSVRLPESTPTTCKAMSNITFLTCTN